MPIQKLKDFLDTNDIRWVSIKHSPAFTAQEIAASAHIPGQEVAKTVMVKIDGDMAMAVLPATKMLNLNLLKEAAGADKVEIATEAEFKDIFPQSEVGAMPPFGILYDMKTYVAESLAEDEEIAFNAGSHTELLRVSYKDYERSVQPTVTKLA
jgi:Ala-tRNA(Pro) deacylase